MILLRAEWVVLAILAAVLGVVVAREPMLQFTDCELGHFAVGNPGGIESPAECAASALAYFGFGLIAVLAVPVVLCLAPAAVPRRAVAWAAAAGLAGCPLLGALALMNTIGPSTTPVVVVYPYFLPVAVGAVLLATFHHRLAAATGGSTADLRPASAP
ncbi:hypothetical protein [Rhodococcus sp. NPDC003348]